MKNTWDNVEKLLLSLRGLTNRRIEPEIVVTMRLRPSLQPFVRRLPTFTLALAAQTNSVIDHEYAIEAAFSPHANLANRSGAT
ncbi:hypothetical protein [Paraburkholderia phytofirmans]|uniref:hypothetical protein n=1 Tax=Paraburkholderia phytofirmans TaxID=261302 RepID=UPI0011DFF36E|nr:hypothetical protein [Paraburkholderia phytofirmans]